MGVRSVHAERLRPRRHQETARRDPGGAAMRWLSALILALIPSVALGASTDAQPMPIKNTALRITFPILDADGDLVTGATSPDSECSLDGGTFADCSAEVTEVATASGMYYLELTAGEMN